MKLINNYLTIIFLLFSNTLFAQQITEELAIKNSLNYGKSVAVFGGSVSVIPASETAKDIWRERLGMSVTTYGVSGAGFSSLQGKSLQQQVDEAVDGLTTLLEPIIMTVLGIVIGGLIIAMYLPIFEISKII
jgi:hypothetical protein